MNTQNLKNEPPAPGWWDSLDTVYVAVKVGIIELFETLEAHPSGGLVGSVLVLLLVIAVLTFCVGGTVLIHPHPTP